MLDDQGRQRNPHLLDYKLVTCSDAPRDRGRVDRVRLETRARGARRASASRPRCRPPGAIANAIAKVIGSHVDQLPMTPERVWARIPGQRRMTPTFTSRRDRSTTRSPPSPPARDRSPAAPTSSSVRVRARRRCPTRSSRSTASRASARIEMSDGGLRLGTLVDPRRHRGQRRDPRAASPPSPTPRRSSARTRRARRARSAAT